MHSRTRPHPCPPAGSLWIGSHLATGRSPTSGSETPGSSSSTGPCGPHRLRCIELHQIHARRSGRCYSPSSWSRPRSASSSRARERRRRQSWRRSASPSWPVDHLARRVPISACSAGSRRCWRVTTVARAMPGARSTFSVAASRFEKTLALRVSAAATIAAHDRAGARRGTARWSTQLGQVTGLVETATVVTVPAAIAVSESSAPMQRGDRLRAQPVDGCRAGPRGSAAAVEHAVR